jgi:hypothetical protein
MALEDSLLAGRDAARSVVDGVFCRTCDGRHGFRSPTARWGWIASQSRRLFAAQSEGARINYLLNLSLFAGVTAVIFSGILTSQKAIPMLTGTKAALDMDWRWDALNHQFSNAVLILSGFHLAVNWDLALAAGQKIFRRVGTGAR